MIKGISTMDKSVKKIGMLIKELDKKQYAWGRKWIEKAEDERKLKEKIAIVIGEMERMGVSIMLEGDDGKGRVNFDKIMHIPLKRVYKTYLLASWEACKKEAKRRGQL